MTTESAAQVENGSDQAALKAQKAADRELAGRKRMKKGKGGGRKHKVGPVQHVKNTPEPVQVIKPKRKRRTAAEMAAARAAGEVKTPTPAGKVARGPRKMVGAKDNGQTSVAFHINGQIDFNALGGAITALTALEKAQELLKGSGATLSFRVG